MRAAILVFALLIVSALPVSAAPDDGVVSGQILNKTAGGGSTGGTPITLVAFGRKEQVPLGQKTTQADAEGHYTFSGLDRDPNIVYLTLARFQNVNYPTDQPFQLQDASPAQADIGVYETTSTDESIKLETLNLLVMGADQGIVQLMEMGALVNGGDRTFVTANPQDQALARAIKLSLPSGAMNIQMQTGFNSQDVIQALGGIQVVSPLPPGRREFAMSFQLPYSGSNVDLSMQLPYPTSAYSVYLPTNGLKLDGSPLIAGPATQLGGQSYALYSGSNLSKASIIGGQLSGLGGNGLATNQLALISLGVVLFIVGGGVLVFGSRFRLATASRSQRKTDPEQERLELVVRLAALDERFANGELSQMDYTTERERGKQRLRELMLSRQHASPSGV